MVRGPYGWPATVRDAWSGHGPLAHGQLRGRSIAFARPFGYRSRMRKISYLAAISLCSTLVLSACGDDDSSGDTPDAGSTTPDAAPQPFGSAEDVARAETLWTEISGASTYRDWDQMPGVEGVQASTVPDVRVHGDFRAVYINQAAAGSLSALPFDAIVVKENLTGESADSAQLESISVMKKIEGYAEDTGDWFWAKYDAQGELLRTPTGVALAGQITGCLSCHGPEADQVFLNNALTFGSADDITRAGDLWQTITTTDDYTMWGTFDGAEGIQPDTSEVHGDFRQVFINAKADEDPLVLGAGSILVKENRVGASADATQIDSLTVMSKIEGYDAATADWFWVKFDPQGNLSKSPGGIPLAGRIGKGTTGGCIGCHAGEEDYSFLNAPIQPAGR
jgi:hypothetical protein